MKHENISGKKIIVGITGGIAAYKSCLLIRSLRLQGAEVRVVITPSALEFITPLTLAALSGNEVITSIFPKEKSNLKMSTWHIDYALWADLTIIAPATINTIAKIAHGFADNPVTTIVTALRTPLIISPAADVDMYQNPITQKNIKILEELGYFIIPAEEGNLASGLSGFGRLPELEKLLDAIDLVLSNRNKDLKGKKILVTAGPTFEDIDPVRFIGNRSSGKMGNAIANSAFLRGANVTLITGPVSNYSYPEIKKINVRSAEEMKNAVDNELKNNDVLIMSAAVADYKPTKVSNKKIKKEDGLSSINLTKTTDILSSIKKQNKIVVGFALETDNEKENAFKKLSSKNLDLIILNSLNDKGSGFEHDTNKIIIIDKKNNKKEFPLLSKLSVANNILDEILPLIGKKKTVK